MQLPLKKTTTRLIGQVLTYYYNGIVDAKVTEEIEHYYKTSGQQFLTQGTVTQQRAAQLLEAGEQSPDFIIGLAFTMYRTNGYGNYICGKRLQNSIKSRYKADIDQFLLKHRQLLEEHLEVTHDYEEEKDGWLPFFGFWMENSMRTFKSANEFAQSRFEYPHQLDKHQVVKACLTVQKQNSRHNLQTGRNILAEPTVDDPKVQFLHQAAQELADPELFLRSCAFTQKFAAHSDKTLIGLLKLRFPKTAR